MRKQDQLLELIAALTPNEKRYFKLYTNIQDGEKRYLKLFDILEKEVKYDVKVLCAKLKISAQQLADDKKYLTGWLLNSLRSLDDETSAPNKITSVLMQARSLFDRKLYEYSLQYAVKAETMANELEMHYLLPAIITQKQTCLWRLGRYKELPGLSDQNATAVQRLTDTFEIIQTSFALTAVEQNREKGAASTTILKNPIFKKKPEDFKSLRTFIVWFNLKLREQMLCDNDRAEWAALVDKSIAHAEANPALLEINPLGYLYMYIEQSQAHTANGNFGNALKATDRLLTLLKKPPKAAAKAEIESLRIFALNAQSTTLCHANRFEEALPLCTEVYAYAHKVPPYFTFGYTFDYALALLHVNKPVEANKKLNDLLQMNAEVRKDNQNFLRPMQIMAQLAQGNYTLVPYLVKSTRAWMKRQKINSPDIELFLTLAFAISRAPLTGHKQAWLNLKEAVNTGKLEQFETLYFKFWIEVMHRELRIAA